jgi:hypothetical protein
MHVHLLTKNAYENMKAQSAVLNTDHKIARKSVSVFPQVTVNSPATESLISLLVKLIGNVM